ncbi:unnamed protein product [Penicillium nalgiovense]|nr:unnamed protein product [Penicillium nalgiovense]
MYGTTVFKSQLARRLIDDKHIARLGKKTLHQYLAPWKESSHQGGIDEIAFTKDADTMERLKSECTESILSIGLCSDEIDPDDELTAEERQSVEDQLKLRRLRL